MKMKDYSRRNDVIHEEVLLPAHAPPEYRNREVLWNSVEGNEKRFDAQYARRIVAALPRELSQRDYIDLMRAFCQDNFVSKGMCCDLAIHDDGKGNPHAHIMLTMRGIDENGKWMPNSKMVYELDGNGNRIKLSSGNYKSHKENTVDWNDRRYAEIWRHNWELINNRFLEWNGRSERLDMRSYKRQGKDKVPTVHMGGAALGMERKGVRTFLGSLNSDIKKANEEKTVIRRSLKGLVQTFLELNNELKEAEEDEKRNSLTGALLEYMDIRREKRRDWTVKGQNTGTAKDLNEISSFIAFIQAMGLTDMKKFREYTDELLPKDEGLQRKIKNNERRIREINNILDSFQTVKDYGDIHNKYQKIYWKRNKEKYRLEHEEELDAYDKADRYLRARYPELKIPVKKLKAELEELTEADISLENERKVMASEVDKVKKIRQILKKMRSEIFGNIEDRTDDAPRTASDRR